MGTRFVFFLLAAIAAALAIPFAIAAGLARYRRRRVSQATEIAVHYPDLDSARPEQRDEIVPPATGEAPRVISLASLARGGVRPLDIKCAHKHDAYPRLFVLFAERVALADDIPACAQCASAFIQEHGVRCQSCKRFLFPGDDVAATEPGQATLSAYVHLQTSCCDDIGRYAGVWGIGRLIPLHELHTGILPMSGVQSLDRRPFGGRRDRGTA